MSEFTQFEASTPVVKPATSEVTYDKYWLKRLNVSANDSTKPIEMVAMFVPARDMTATIDVDGVPTTISYKELMPDGPEKVLRIDDVFALAEANNTFAATMNAVFDALKTIATDRGLL